VNRWTGLNQLGEIRILAASKGPIKAKKTTIRRVESRIIFKNEKIKFIEISGLIEIKMT
jgi:hypothetical protein